ncbi:MAG TPA: twin-arginine translocase TatA/TatE family subunit [Flavobacteriaceae bacterium]|nr:twin-arginine translocase TatA/TatE family subunit [Flavobacteriaceae bacterium]
MFLFISGSETFFIVIVIIMIFGADKIPEIARGLGKGMRQVKDATNDIKREINKTAENNGIDTSIVEDIKKTVNKAKTSIEENFEDIAGPIKRK